ncbi:hypothetical protein BDW71DRAFT_206485 [Aspergillus fruticulosus]
MAIARPPLSIVNLDAVSLLTSHLSAQSLGSQAPRPQLQMPSATANPASVTHSQYPDPPPGAMNADARALNPNVIHPGQPGSGAHNRRSSTSTIKDYSRIMLEYTERRMAGFAGRPGASDRGSATSRSSSSNTSGQSGTSTSGILAGQASGPSPGLAGPTHSPADPKIRRVDFGAGVSDGV